MKHVIVITTLDEGSNISVGLQNLLKDVVEQEL